MPRRTTGDRAHADPKDRFWRGVERKGPDECWEWTRSKNKGGYGRLRAGGRSTGTIIASRMSYELHNGEIPPGLLVRHTCDNRSCVNPHHLVLGTHAENSADMWDRGRQPSPLTKARGEAAAKAKLTEEDVRYVRASAKNNAELARELGVCTPTVRAIRVGRTWKHLT